MGDRSATIDVSRQLGAVPLLGGGAGSPCNTMWPGPRPTFVPSGILIHLVIWPQRTWPNFWRGAAPFGVELGPYLTQFCPGRAYHRTKWHLDPSSRLATTNIRRKLGVCPLLGEGELRPPSSTVWPGVRPTSVKR